MHLAMVVRRRLQVIQNTYIKLETARMCLQLKSSWGQANNLKKILSFYFSMFFTSEPKKT